MTRFYNAAFPLHVSKNNIAASCSAYDVSQLELIKCLKREKGGIKEEKHVNAEVTIL